MVKYYKQRNGVTLVPRLNAKPTKTAAQIKVEAYNRRKLPLSLEISVSIQQSLLMPSRAIKMWCIKSSPLLAASIPCVKFSLHHPRGLWRNQNRYRRSTPPPHLAGNFRACDHFEAPGRVLYMLVEVSG